jgi:adenylate cyclase
MVRLQFAAKTAALVAVLALPLVFQSTLTEILKLRTFDYFVSEHEQSNYFAVLNITEEDIEREGGWPLPRARLAEIQNDLMQRGALGVGWAVAFPQPDRLGGDEEFAQSLQGSNSVLAMYENPGSGFPETVGTVIMGDPVGGYAASGVVQNIETLRNAASQGIASAPVEVDQLVRRMPLLMRAPDGWVPAFGTQVLKVLANADTYIIRTNQNGIQEIIVQGLPPVATDSLGRKWISWVSTHQTTLAEMDVQDRFVFIGTDAAGIMPQLATAIGLLEPHRIQAALAESILITDSPRIPDWSLAAELAIFALTVALVWVLATKLGITLGVVSFFAIFASTGAYGAYSIQQGVLLDVTWTLISQFVSASGAFYLNFRTQYQLRQLIKKQFEHYLDPRQVKVLQDNPDQLVLGGERKRCTYLFTDVRNFTAMSERLEPEEVTEIMNKALSIQADAVLKHGGMIDKTIGDALMAVFNAPLDLDDHETAAVRCAIEMQENMKASSLGVEIGVGVQTGDAVLGNMGSKDRFTYTVIGDSVNQAARYESATKEVGVNIIVGHETATNCKYLLKSLDPIKVKGKSEPLRIYTYAD